MRIRRLFQIPLVLTLTLSGTLPALSAPVVFLGAQKAGFTLSIIGSSGDTVALFLLPADTSCTAEAIKSLTPIPIVTVAGIPAKRAVPATSTSPAQPATPAVPAKFGLSIQLTNSSTDLTLAAPVKADDHLCLQATSAAGGATATFADAKVVAKEDYTFVHTFYTLGGVASNQLSTANSTNAAQYVDLGVHFNLLSENKSFIGIDKTISGRFSTVPVTAKASGSGTATGAAAASAPASTLNILSSQESARILETASFPIRLGGRGSSGDSFFVAPLIIGGFTTLLNPSSTLNATDGTKVNVSFSPTYNEWSVGARLGWREYYGSLDKPYSTHTWAELDLTMGKYSNLQSIECGKVSQKGLTTAPTTTSCFDTITGSDGSVSYNTLKLVRTSVPRLELNGFYKSRSLPLILGIDANLDQYSVFQPKRLDTSNRAGSDVRIYFGVQGSLSDLFKSLKLSTPGGGN